MSDPTQEHSTKYTICRYGTFTLCGCPFQGSFAFMEYSDIEVLQPPDKSGFGLFPFRSPLLGESRLISFPQLLRCFSSLGFLLAGYFIYQWLLCQSKEGFPIRKSSGQCVLGRSPRHIAYLSRPSSEFGVKAFVSCFLCLLLKTFLLTNNFYDFCRKKLALHSFTLPVKLHFFSSVDFNDHFVPLSRRRQKILSKTKRCVKRFFPKKRRFFLFSKEKPLK